MAGIRLADYWAWLRYFPAVHGWRELCLLDEWNEIDPHQKTILSDDWGVGLTTGVLGQALGVVSWADTQHVIKICGAAFGKLTSANKTGPKKSPDFVGVTAGLEFLALECKGTQSGRSYLKSQLADGVAQKQSLSFSPAVTSLGTYVAGAFIPLYSGDEHSCLRLRDPEPEDPVPLPNGPAELRAAVVQSELASHLRLCGFVDLARAFEHSTLDAPTPLNGMGRTFPGNRWIETDGGRWRGFSRQFPLDWGLEAAPGGPIGAEVSIGLSEATLGRLTESNDVMQAATEVASVARAPHTAFIRRQRRAGSELGEPLWEHPILLETPLGVRVAVDWLR